MGVQRDFWVKNGVLGEMSVQKDFWVKNGVLGKWACKGTFRSGGKWAYKKTFGLNYCSLSCFEDKYICFNHLKMKTKDHYQ